MWVGGHEYKKVILSLDFATACNVSSAVLEVTFLEAKQIAFKLSQKPKNQIQEGKFELGEKTSIFVLHQRWVKKNARKKRSEKFLLLIFLAFGAT
jgi:hypothetical protein